MNDQAFQFSPEAWTQTKNLQFYINPGTIFFHKLFLTVFGGGGEGMVCSIIFVYGEFPNNLGANNIKIKLVSNNMKIKLFTRKFGSFVNPPYRFTSPSYQYSILLYLFLTLTATETRRCYWGGFIYFSLTVGELTEKIRTF